MRVALNGDGHTGELLRDRGLEAERIAPETNQASSSSPAGEVEVYVSTSASKDLIDNPTMTPESM